MLAPRPPPVTPPLVATTPRFDLCRSTAIVRTFVAFSVSLPRPLWSETGSASQNSVTWFAQQRCTCPVVAGCPANDAGHTKLHRKHFGEMSKSMVAACRGLRNRDDTRTHRWWRGGTRGAPDAGGALAAGEHRLGGGGEIVRVERAPPTEGARAYGSVRRRERRSASGDLIRGYQMGRGHGGGGEGGPLLGCALSLRWGL